MTIVQNFAPSPIGFLEPDAAGLKPNFYLPNGVTDYLPKIADKLKLGIPEQRVEDELRAQAAAQAKATSQYLGGLKAVSGESDDTLAKIATGVGGLERSGVVIATSGIGLKPLQQAALDTLAVRAAQRAGQLPEGDVIDVVKQLQAQGVEITTMGVLKDGTFSPVAVKANNTLAIASGEAAEGIRKELIHERADP